MPRTKLHISQVDNLASDTRRSSSQVDDILNGSYADLGGMTLSNFPAGKWLVTFVGVVYLEADAQATFKIVSNGVDFKETTVSVESQSVGVNASGRLHAVVTAIVETPGGADLKIQGVENTGNQVTVLDKEIIATRVNEI